jgi:hypothetical protein
MNDAFVPTTFARRLLARLEATHDKRGIAVFAGPPGIGKTTALDAFGIRHAQECAIVKIERQGARQLVVLQAVLNAVRRTAASPLRAQVDKIPWLREEIFNTVQRLGAAQTEENGSGAPRLTLIFDEAQNLSRQAIEALRYWNDRDRCYGPFPLGLVFVGNNEFALQADGAGHSAISAAVADRALFIEHFDYADITDEDLHLFVRSKLDAREDVISGVARWFQRSGAPRSLRRTRIFLEELEEIADGQPITHQLVEQVLNGG